MTGRGRFAGFADDSAVPNEERATLERARGPDPPGLQNGSRLRPQCADCRRKPLPTITRPAHPAAEAVRRPALQPPRRSPGHYGLHIPQR